ncbi:MAG: sporulation initiation factor Spo0A C-terminal domain-containing protein, partial [Oscillospiraceae bacterium]
MICPKVLVSGSGFFDDDLLINSFKQSNIDVKTVKPMGDTIACSDIEIAVLKYEPHVLIMYITELDAQDLFRLINNLNQLDNPPKIITIGIYSNECSRQKLLSMKVQKCLDLPYSFASICRLIRSTAEKISFEPSEIENDIYKSINDVLTMCGFHSGMQGFIYIREVLFRYVISDNKKLNLSKEVYPDIAKEYNISNSKIEWDIRSSIGQAWKKCPD